MSHKHDKELHQWTCVCMPKVIIYQYTLSATGIMILLAAFFLFHFEIGHIRPTWTKINTLVMTNNKIHYTPSNLCISRSELRGVTQLNVSIHLLTICSTSCEQALIIYNINSYSLLHRLNHRGAWSLFWWFYYILILHVYVYKIQPFGSKLFSK